MYILVYTICFLDKCVYTRICRYTHITKVYTCIYKYIQKSSFLSRVRGFQMSGGYLPIIAIFKTPQPKREMRASLPRSGRRPAGFATLKFVLHACSTIYKLVTRLFQVRTVTFSRDSSRKWQSLWSVGENPDRSLLGALLCWRMLGSVS